MMAMDTAAFFILPLATCHCEQLEIKHLNNFEIYAIVKRSWHSYQRICLNSSVNNDINIDCDFNFSFGICCGTFQICWQCVSLSL